MCTKAKRARSCQGTEGSSLNWLSRPVASSRQRQLFYTLLGPYPASPEGFLQPFGPRCFLHVNSKSSRIDGKRGRGFASLTPITCLHHSRSIIVCTRFVYCLSTSHMMAGPESSFEVTRNNGGKLFPFPSPPAHLRIVLLKP